MVRVSLWPLVEASFAILDFFELAEPDDPALLEVVLAFLEPGTAGTKSLNCVFIVTRHSFALFSISSASFFISSALSFNVPAVLKKAT